MKFQQQLLSDTLIEIHTVTADVEASYTLIVTQRQYYGTMWNQGQTVNTYR